MFWESFSQRAVPIYTIHCDPEIWRDGIQAFRLEWWFKLDQAWIQHGPRSIRLCNHSHAWISLTKIKYRACVARNVTMVTLLIFITTIFRRYTFILEEDLTKPVSNLSLANISIN